MNIYSEPDSLSPRSKDSLSLWVWLAICFGVASFVTAVAIMWVAEDSSKSIDQTPKEVAAGPSLSLNPTHNKLLGLSDRDQASILGVIVGDSCTGTTAFFMGMDQTDTAFWSVGCENGKDYSLAILADSDGSSRVMGCDLLWAATQLNCFEPIKGMRIEPRQ